MATNGGARPGAGRKPKADKYAGAINRAEKKIADKLPQLVDNLLKLANGGFEVVEEKWIPRAAFSLGDIIANQAGADTPEGKEAIENPFEMVLSERKSYIAQPDRASNQYLIDRIGGKPTIKVKDEDAQDKISMYGQLIQEMRKDRGLLDLESVDQDQDGLTGNGSI
jgi:hypothetical protein